MTSQNGSIIGLIGSVIMLFGIMILLPIYSGGLYTILHLFSTVIFLIWPVLGMVGAILGIMGKDSQGGIYLLIASIGGGFGFFFAWAISVWFIDVSLMLIGGILSLEKPKEISDKLQSGKIY